MKTATLTLMLLLLTTVTMATDSKIDNWIGRWDMNNDDVEELFEIIPLEEWEECEYERSDIRCQVKIIYKSNGEFCPVTIDSISENFSNMIFTVKFPRYNQTFDAFLFSETSDRMSGISTVGDRRFGFVGVKK